MDLGFAGLIEKIEERFGKLITNLLLLAVLLVIFAWAVETIASIYVSGTKLWEGRGYAAILGFGKIVFVYIIFVFISCIVIFSIFQRIKAKTIKYIEKAGIDVKKDVEEYGEKKIAEVTQKLNGKVEELRMYIKK